MYELEESDYNKVLPLFKGVHLKLVKLAVAQGNQPARIWVDNLENPQTAFMWDKAHCYYLVGNEENHSYNKAVRKLITETIAPEAVKNDFSVLKVYYTEGWKNKICEIVDIPLVKRERQCYTFSSVKTNWRSKVPSGSSVKYIDEELLKAHLGNTEYVIEEIESMWVSLDDFFTNGFGFCSVYDEEIVCWCTAEYVSDTYCGIGIETIQKYQNKGFATVTASAFVEHCIARSITPHWDSWSNNIPSLKVAEKVGFEIPITYVVYFGSFDDFETYLIRGDYHYGQKEYEKSAEWYEKALKIKKSSRLYYEVGRAYFLAGKNNKALKNLKKAIDAGFTDVERLLNDESLKGLHRTKEWQTLVERIQK